jgi:undecaprenyl-diphosphatase
MIPVMVVGLFFKDAVEDLFGEGLVVVGCCLLITALLLWLSDLFGGRKGAKEHRNGISFAQAFTVGIGQACAVAPGLSRSGTTIATGLLTGVRRDVMAQFSFLMVLVPIVGEQLLSVLKSLHGGDPLFGPEVSALSLALGFVAAFLSGLFACRAMVALVRRAKLYWFSIYCVLAAVLCLFL